MDLKPFWWAMPKHYGATEIAQALADEFSAAQFAAMNGSGYYQDYLSTRSTLTNVAERLGIVKEYESARQGVR